MDRQRFIACFSTLGLTGTLLPGALAALALGKEHITTAMIREAEKIAGLTFTESERQEIAMTLNKKLTPPENRQNRHPFPSVASLPVDSNPKRHRQFIHINQHAATRHRAKSQMPFPTSEMAHLPITRLSRLIRSRQITSVELTRLYLDRLRQHIPLNAATTLTEERAMSQARHADREINTGRCRGPLHGIPWAVKDIFATKGFPTATASSRYRDLAMDRDATVVRRLEEAGAVLVAKLPIDDHGIDEIRPKPQIRKPLQPNNNSNATVDLAFAAAAGLVGFAIGTETAGSLIWSARKYGVNACRPTFGRVSRSGVMALSWSYGTIGPICRSAEDCALALSAIVGPDDKDQSVMDLPFNWDSQCNIKTLRVGYLKSQLEQKPKNATEKSRKAAEKQILKCLNAMGIETVAIETLAIDLPAANWDSLTFGMAIEAVAARDKLMIEGKHAHRSTDLLRSRSITTAGYLQSTRERFRLIEQVDEIFRKVDAVLGSYIPLTNATGHPEVVIPFGVSPDGREIGVSFTGRLYDEEKLLALAHACQRYTTPSLTIAPCS